jgi:hypothetical protein
MPGADLNDLWRRVRDAEPVTCMIPFPDSGEYHNDEKVLAMAAEHRAKIHALLAELDHEDAKRFLDPQYRTQTPELRAAA